MKTKNAKHTPQYEIVKDKHFGVVIQGAEYPAAQIWDRSTCSIVAGVLDPKRAPLLAAAPDLLEALSEMLKHFEHVSTDNYYADLTREVKDKARAAIAKAEGK